MTIAISAPLSSDNQIIRILEIHGRHFVVLSEVSNPGVVVVSFYIDLWSRWVANAVPNGAPK